MSKNKVVPLLVNRGWCIVMIERNANKPIMYWDRDIESFNGLLTITTLFEDKNVAISKCKEFKKNPTITYEVVPVEHRYINGDISIKLN